MSTCTAIGKQLVLNQLEKTIETTEDTWGICEILAANISESATATVEFYVGKDPLDLAYLGKFELKQIPDVEQNTLYKGAIATNEAIFVKLISGAATIRATLVSEVSYLTNGKSSTIGYTKKETNALIADLQAKLVDLIKNGNLPTTPTPGTDPIVNPSKPDIKALAKAFEASYEEAKIYQFSLNGVNDPGNELVKYKITNILGGVVFSKTNNIVPNELLQMITPTVTETTAASFDIIAVSSDSVASDPAHINIVIKDVVYIKPDVSKATSTLARDMYESTSVIATFNNITDNSGNQITLDLILPPELTASKTKGLNVGEFVTLSASTVDENTTVEIKVLATNSIGTSTVSYFVNLIDKSSMPPVIDNLTMDLPTKLIYGKTYPVKFSNAYDPEGDGFSLSITSIVGASVDKSVGIAVGDTVVFTTTSDKKVGKVTFVVVATDNNGARSTIKTFNVDIAPPVNHNPDLTNLTLGIPNNTVVSATNNNLTFSGIVDQDGDTLTITLTGAAAVRCSAFENIKVTDTVVFNAPTLNDNVPTTLDLVVNVADGNGGVNSKTVMITVTP